MSREIHIISSCIIRGHGIYKDGDRIFKAPESDTAAFFLAAYRFVNVQYPRFHKMDLLSKLGWLGAEILLEGQELPGEHERGIILSNASSSLDTDEKYQRSVNEIPSPALFVYTLPNIVIGEISIRHRFKGESAFFISDRFDPLFMEQYVSNLINNNILQVCICGWVELLGDRYETVLFLAGNKHSGASVPFTQENINKIYESENG